MEDHTIFNPTRSFDCSLKRDFKSSCDIVLASVRLIKKLIGESKWQTAHDLLKILRQEYKLMFERIPNETLIKNIWKRVMKIIKDESIR